jgi:hypothetical protein
VPGRCRSDAVSPPVGAIARCDAAEAIPNPRNSAGAREAKPSVDERHAEKLDAIAYGGRHVDARAGELAVFGRAALAFDDDLAAVKREAFFRAADARHRIGHQHRGSPASQCQPQHGGRDMDSVDDQTVPAAGRFQRRRDGSGLARLKRPHGVEEMGEAGQTFGDGAARLLVTGHGMAERNANTVTGEGADESVRHPLGRQCEECDAGSGEKLAMRGIGRAHQGRIMHARFLGREERPFEMDAEHGRLCPHRRIDRGAGRAHGLVGIGDERG